MSFYPDVAPGDTFVPNAKLSNDVRHLVNAAHGFQDCFQKGGSPGSVRISVFNATEEIIPQNTAVVFSSDAPRGEACDDRDHGLRYSLEDTGSERIRELPADRNGDRDTERRERELCPTGQRPDICPGEHGKCQNSARLRRKRGYPARMQRRNHGTGNGI